MTGTQLTLFTLDNIRRDKVTGENIAINLIVKNMRYGPEAISVAMAMGMKVSPSISIEPMNENDQDFLTLFTIGDSMGIGTGTMSYNRRNVTTLYYPEFVTLIKALHIEHGIVLGTKTEEQSQVALYELLGMEVSNDS